MMCSQVLPELYKYMYNIFLYVAGETCEISDKRSFWSSPVANNQGTFITVQVMLSKLQ